MRMVIILVLLAVASSTLGAATLMPEISWFNLMELEVLDGKAEIIASGGEFVCECVPMPPDCGSGTGNPDCESGPCVSTDFCTSCAPGAPGAPLFGGDGLACDQAPNVSGPYFLSAGICEFDTTCPVPP